jgi:hypothetical protein
MLFKGQIGLISGSVVVVFNKYNLLYFAAAVFIIVSC